MIDFDDVERLARERGARAIAIDGLPLSGKSTLAERLVSALHAEAIYLDDFVRPEAEWRGKIKPKFPFDYIRYDAFLEAVKTITRYGTCTYLPYDWPTGSLSREPRVIAPTGPVIVEGVSVLHPQLAPLYDLGLWVESDAGTTLEASLNRGVGNWEREWRELFMPSVALYLMGKPQERADFRVAGRGVSRHKEPPD